MYILKKRETQTLFRFVETLQEQTRGTTFCSLSLNMATKGLEVCAGSYLPTDPNAEYPVAKKGRLVVGIDVWPRRVEHFLQKIRLSFPGVGFQSLTVSFDGIRLLIKHRS